MCILPPRAWGFTKRDVAIGAIAMILATGLTVFGTNYVLHKFVLDNPNDPLTRQGGLKPEQQIIGDRNGLSTFSSGKAR